VFTRKIALRNWEISCLVRGDYEKAHLIRRVLDGSTVSLFDYLATELKDRIRHRNAWWREDLEKLALEEKEINDLICKLKEVYRESNGNN
jgi:hypothetical protein